MNHKPAPKHNTPVPESRTQRSGQRDTLNDTPELRFLRDEIEALLGSASVRRSTHAPAVGYADDHGAIAPEDLAKELARATEPEPSQNEAASAPDGTLEAMPTDNGADTVEDALAFEDSAYERDTEPSLDVQLLREVVRIAGK